MAVIWALMACMCLSALLGVIKGMWSWARQRFKQRNGYFFLVSSSKFVQFTNLLCLLHVGLCGVNVCPPWTT